MIDCGTNSTRLYVVGADGTPLRRTMRITRLGEGVDAFHKLSPAAIGRTVGVLREMHDDMEACGVVRSRLVATSAVRDASNGDEFLAAAAEASGADAEVLSGDEEGRLAFAGAAGDLGPVDGDLVIVDIGGGSTELVVGRDGDVDTISLDLGCVRLTERHLLHDPPTPDELGAAADHVREELDGALRAIPALGALRAGSLLVGLAGTVSTLVTLELGIAEYRRDLVHHAVLPAPSVARWCDVLAGEPAATRAMRVGMVPGREDVILGGAIVLREVMERLGFDSCIESEADILDGIAAELLGQAGGPGAPDKTG